jgi:hypothetical protein
MAKLTHLHTPKPLTRVQELQRKIDEQTQTIYFQKQCCVWLERLMQSEGGISRYIRKDLREEILQDLENWRTEKD